MAEPKKQDLIEQYEELVKKRHALEAKKQFAVTMGVADVALPGASVVRGAYKTRKALGAAGEVAGAARVGEEAAALIPDPSASYYRLLMDQASGYRPDLAGHRVTSIHKLAQDPHFDLLQKEAEFFLRPASVPYAKARAKVNFLEGAQEQFRAKISTEFGGLSPAEVDDVIKEVGMNSAFLKAEGPSADWIKSTEKQTGISWDELVEREGGRPDLRVLTKEAKSEVQSAAKAFEQRQEDYTDMLIARDQPRMAQEAGHDQIMDLIIKRSEMIEKIEYPYNRAHKSRNAAQRERILAPMQKEVDEITDTINSLLSNIPQQRELVKPTHKNPFHEMQLGRTVMFPTSKHVHHRRYSPHGGSLHHEISPIMKAKAYEKSKAMQEAARVRRVVSGSQRASSEDKGGGIADMSATDLAKQYAEARLKMGVSFTPVVGAVAEYREADQELAKVNAQLKALTEGASPKDRVRLEDYLISEGSPSQEEDDLKWGEPTEEPPE